MQMQLTVDTSQPKDRADLLIVANALSGAAPAAPQHTPAPAVKTEVKTGQKAGDLPKPEPAPAASSDTRVTVEMVREAASTKKASDCKAAFKTMGFEGLSTIPAERLGEALELVKALPNK